MCGVVGSIGIQAYAVLYEGLSRISYRGYDSAGIGLYTQETQEGFNIYRTVGDVSHLPPTVSTLSKVGIGHIRWATHGAVTERNAHPHTSGHYALVHNGIIENTDELNIPKNLLKSETDTEHFVHLLEKYHSDIALETLEKALEKIKGSYAFIVMTRSEKLLFAKKSSPLILGRGTLGPNNHFFFLSSDALAFPSAVREVYFLHDGDYGEIDTQQNLILKHNGKCVSPTFEPLQQSHTQVSKQSYDHFMYKEINEQPIVLRRLLQEKPAQLPERPLTFLGCGTSYFAGCVARKWFGGKRSIQVEIASEYVYEKPFLPPNTFFVGISQSGETMDTLKALESIASQDIGALVNTAQSTMVRRATQAWFLECGPEVGVAATKSFTAQLLRLVQMLGASQDALSEIPQKIEQLLQNVTPFEEMGKKLSRFSSAIFIGRGELFPIAQEGALKMKELSYIHAQAYPGGELKHGPIALIDENVPVIALMPSNALFVKMRSNIEEIKSRGGHVVVITDEKGATSLPSFPQLKLPVAQQPYTNVFLCAVAMQLLAYFTALAKGNNIDKPRNLAKSVTVE